MAMTLTQVTHALRQLEDELPHLIEDNPVDADFWPAFSGQAKFIEDNAGPDHAELVRSKINCMLGSAGLVPGDNEGEHCVD